MQSDKMIPIILASLTTIFYGICSIVIQQLYVIFVYSKSYFGAIELPLFNITLLDPFIIEGAFLFILYRLFLSQFGQPILSLKNIIFAILLPFLYIASIELISALLSLIALPFLNSDNDSDFILQLIHHFRAFFGPFIAMVLFLILVNLITPSLLQSQNNPVSNIETDKRQKSSSLNFALLISFMVVIIGDIDFHLFPYILLPAYEDAPFFSSMFLLLFTLIIVGYFTVWNHHHLQQRDDHLDVILNRGLKICLLLIFFWILWDFLANFVNDFGSNNFIADLNRTHPPEYLSHVTSAGFSIIMLIVAFILSIFIARSLSVKKQQIMHYSALLLLFSIILYDAISWGLPFRLMLFQCSLFMLSITLILSILTVIYPFIWNLTMKQSIRKNL